MKKRKPYPWTVKTKMISIRVAETTAAQIKARAVITKVNPQKLLRFFIETGLGMERPGLPNADSYAWEILRPQADDRYKIY